MEQNTVEKKSISLQKKVLIIVGAILAALLIIYMGFSIYFMNHFCFRTTINGVDVSGVSVEKAKEEVQKAMDHYELSVVERDGSIDTIQGSDFGLQIVWGNQVEELLEAQNAFAWGMKLFTPDQLQPEVDMSYDAELLKAQVESLSCMQEEKQIAPVDAGISEYEEGKGYSLISAVPGTLIDKEVLQSTVEECVQKLESNLDLVERTCYVQPVYDDNNEKLLAALEQMNKALDTVITYEIGESTEVLDKDTFMPWISVNDKMEVCIDEDALTTYVQEISYKYNTAYRSKTLMTSYGKEVTITGGHYGWLVNQEKEREAIVKEILAGEPVTRDLHYSRTANSRDGNDYGNSYVEINLTAQHLFLYVDGELIVESDFVSGDLSIEGRYTPGGAYGITYLDKDAILRGEDYETPVTYWMPFNGDIGMHDATWRSSFGASIYKRNGSHGCVNLPLSAAKTIFENVEAGFPVLCYNLDGTQSEEGIAQDEAYKVIDKINAIGDKITLKSEKKIEKAREAYDALSDLAKKYVTNYSKLKNAEKKLAKLKK